MYSLSIQLKAATTVRGKFVTMRGDSRVWVGVYINTPEMTFDGLSILGTVEQHQAIIDAWQKGLDAARAELAEQAALEEAKAIEADKSKLQRGINAALGIPEAVEVS